MQKGSIKWLLKLIAFKNVVTSQKASQNAPLIFL